MSVPTLVVVATVALLSVLALGLVLLALVGHVRRLMSGVLELRDELEPTVRRLVGDAEVTRRELEAVTTAAERLRGGRTDRSQDPSPGAQR